MAKKNWVNEVVLTLVAVGALNWLLVALAQFDIVASLTNTLKISGADTLLYTLIGASGVWLGIMALMGKVKIN